MGLRKKGLRPKLKYSQSPFFLKLVAAKRTRKAPLSALLPNEFEGDVMSVPSGGGRGASAAAAEEKAEAEKADEPPLPLPAAAAKASQLLPAAGEGKNLLAIESAEKMLRSPPARARRADRSIEADSGGGGTCFQVVEEKGNERSKKNVVRRLGHL